jgi:hypothetical protein
MKKTATFFTLIFCLAALSPQPATAMMPASRREQ